MIHPKRELLRLSKQICGIPNLATSLFANSALQLKQQPAYRRVKKTSGFILKNKSNILCENLFSVDLGCGMFPKNPFDAEACQGLDITASPPAINHWDAIQEAIPLDNESCSSVTAYDFIEHIPRAIIKGGKSYFPFVEIMSEIHRVLKPGGVFLSHTPAFPFKQAFQDPTHVNIITEDTFPIYFCGKNSLAKIYGFRGEFQLIDQAWRGPKLLTIIRKA